VRTKLAVNTILAVSFVAISAPLITRIPVHEWLSLAFIVILGLHVLFSWSWIVGVTRKVLGRLRGELRFNYVLDVLSYVAMVVVMISGIVISEAALPAMGLPRPRDRFWSIIHSLSAKAILVLVGVHLAMHWDWVLAALRRLLAGTLAATARQGNQVRGWLQPIAILAGVSLVASLATWTVGKTPIADQVRRAGPGPGARQPGERQTQRATDDQTPRVEPRAELSKEERARRRAARMEDRPGPEGPSNRRRIVSSVRLIGQFMGVPFIAALVAIGLVRRARPTGGRQPIDPLEQPAE
jgi:cytochrome b561